MRQWCITVVNQKSNTNQGSSYEWSCHSTYTSKHRSRSKGNIPDVSRIQLSCVNVHGPKRTGDAGFSNNRKCSCNILQICQEENELMKDCKDCNFNLQPLYL